MTMAAKQKPRRVDPDPPETDERARESADPRISKFVNEFFKGFEEDYRKRLEERKGKHK